jgi:predicted nucleotidyltransferase
MENLLLKENYDSLNLFNKINLLNERELKRVNNGLGWTVNNYPSAILIGGTAVVHYLKGGRDLTPDIDFLVDELSNIKELLENNDILFKSLRAGNLGLIGITVDEFNCDYLDSNVGNVSINKLILKTFKIVNVGGFNVKIINPELLTIMKIELGRDKDVDDGLALIKSGILNKEMYLKYLNVLKNDINDYESLVSYAEML